LPILIIEDTEVEAVLVLFDFDGTLVDGGDRHRNLTRARRETIGRRAGREAVANWARLSGVDLETGRVDPEGPLARAPRRGDLAVATAAVYLTGRTWHESMRLAAEAYEAADALLESTYRPVLLPGVGEALGRMRGAGFRLGIATNGEGSSAEAMVRVLGVDHLFDVVVGAGDVVEAKPAPDMILLACRRVGVAPGEAVFVGDSPEDMLAGREAGVRALISVNNPDERVQRAADYALDSVGDIRVRASV
jgi:phosphoglycolate phosphatase